MKNQLKKFLCFIGIHIHSEQEIWYDEKELEEQWAGGLMAIKHIRCKFCKRNIQ